jgi:hypothetical protein
MPLKNPYIPSFDRKKERKKYRVLEEKHLEKQTL